MNNDIEEKRKIAPNESTDITVRELINKLLYCDMNAVITVRTSNKDSQGRLHHYEFTGVDREDMYAQIFDNYKYGQKMYLPLKFHNWEFDRKVNGEEKTDD